MTTQYLARGLELTSELEKYAKRKVARLGRRLPRTLRAEAACKFTITQTTRKGIKHGTCAIVLKLEDGTEFSAQETTQHMHAAMDIATVHLEQQLKTDVHTRRRGIFRQSLI